MTTSIHRFAVLLVVSAVAAVGLVIGSQLATARPAPAQAIALYGESFWVRLPQCSGSVRPVMTTDRARPGTITVRYVPSRFTRNCRFHVWAGWGLMVPDQLRVPMVSGPRGGPVVTQTYRTGSGIQSVAFGSRTSMPPSAISYYVLVP